MFMLLGGNTKKVQKEASQNDNLDKVRDLFSSGRFPVVTTEKMEGRQVAKVLGLVCCRGFDSEDAFFGMAAMAEKKGAQGIVGYSENVAFHPDGSKYFSCFGTAVIFERESREVKENRSWQNFSDDNMLKAEDFLTLTPTAKAAYAAPATAGSVSMQAAQPVQAAEALEQPDEDDDPVMQRFLSARQKETAAQW